MPILSNDIDYLPISVFREDQLNIIGRRNAIAKRPHMYFYYRRFSVSYNQYIHKQSNLFVLRIMLRYSLKNSPNPNICLPSGE